MEESNQNNDPEKVIYKRSKIIVDFNLQMSIISSFFKVYLLAAASFFLIITFFMSKLKQYAILNKLTDLQVYLKETENNIVILFLIVFVISTAITFYYGFRITHKISGPVYAIQKFLKEILNDESPEALRLRKGDHFTELQDSLNKTITHLNNKKSD